jgi:NDP-sugar pyrophosphorylase family protein
MAEGEELVVEPFRRLIEADQLLAYKHEDFFRSMDTLKDWQTLEEMVEQGRMPWRPAGCPSPHDERIASRPAQRKARGPVSWGAFG